MSGSGDETILNRHPSSSVSQCIEQSMLESLSIVMEHSKKEINIKLAKVEMKYEIKYR
jgi:hypothetical protein